MKVVINVCFGGFSLSPLGEAEYLKRKGKQAYFYKQTKYKFRDGVEEYTRIDEPENDLFLSASTMDLGEKTSDIPDEVYFSGSDIDRNDKDLIAVIEKLKDKANGQCAKLSIVDIPDGIQWEISEYDGNESVEEAHRSWR